MSDQPTLQTVVTDSLTRLDFGATASPLPDKFGKDYRKLHDHYIATLAAEVKAAPPITDKASREVSQKLRTRLVAVRTGLDKTRKALFEPLRNLKAEVDAYIGTTADAGLQGRVKALERVLEQQQEAWDAEQERIRQEAVRKVQERNEARGRKLIEAGMVFDGACYALLDLKVFPSDVSGATDEDFDEWFTRMVLPVAETKREADRIAAEEALADERFRLLLEAGWIVDAETGHAVLDDGVCPKPSVVMREELHVVHPVNFGKWVYRGHAHTAKLKAAKEAEAKAEHERMQAEFRRQAEVQRKQDEERAAIDAERERVRQERLNVRLEALEALGLVRDPSARMVKLMVDDHGGDGGMGAEWAHYSYSTILDADEQQWAAMKSALDALAKEAMRRIEEGRKLREALHRDRSLALLNMGATRDDAGTWTMGKATTTDHILKHADADEWNAALIMFEAEADADQEVDLKTAIGIAGAKADDLPISTAPDEADLRELHACALSLLDEANKAFTILGSDERYSEALAKVQAHASDCVRITRELQSIQPS